MTDKLKITLVPLGGLANRLRAIISGYELAKATNLSFDVVWLKKQGFELSIWLSIPPYGARHHPYRKP